MPKEIYLVKVGMTMTEGMVSEWYIADGAQVEKGEMLYALETEKINLDVDAEATGIVKHRVEAGLMLEPGDVVGFIFEAGEKIPPDVGAVPVTRVDSPPVIEPGGEVMAEPGPVSTSKQGPAKSSPAARRLAKELGVDLAGLTGTGPGGRIIESDIRSAKPDVPSVSPLAKRLAREKGIDISSVQGTGPGGRIVEADINAAANQTASTASSGNIRRPLAGQTVAIKGMRRIIAQRMSSSLQNTAQLTMDMEAVMDDAVRLRQSLIQEWQSLDIRPTYTDLVIKAVAKALTNHPLMNSCFGDTELTLLAEINIGIAVALPDGLVVPVIRNADQSTLKEIAIESARLASAAREGKLGLDDYAGGTFTLSALGMYGVDSFTPIINEPQAGILGINRIYDGLEWNGDTPVKTKKMNLSLTWDHRVIDGAPAAEFLAEVVAILSNPYRLLV